MVNYFEKTSVSSLQTPMHRQTPYLLQISNQSLTDFKIQGILMQFGCKLLFKELKYLTAFHAILMVTSCSEGNSLFMQINPLGDLSLSSGPDTSA